jgi:predicted transposase/invertase (TIGR01784 family)
MDMDFYFIELPKFTRKLEELVEITDKWIFFIKEAENLTVIPENVDDEGLKEAYHDANKHSWEKEELEAYDYAAMREQDERGKVELAEKRADKKAKEEVARKMKQKGLPNQDISDFTGLSVEDIHDL